MAGVITSHGSDRANVTVPYNAPHNVSITADFCHRINATTIIEVYYGKHINLRYSYRVVIFISKMLSHLFIIISSMIIMILKTCTLK